MLGTFVRLIFKSAAERVSNHLRILSVICPCQENHSGASKCCKVVDMAVRVVILVQSLWQPQHLADTNGFSCEMALQQTGENNRRWHWNWHLAQKL